MSSRQEPRHDVVVTGLGIISPLGVGADTFFDKLSNSQSGISKIDFMSSSAAPQNVGGEVKEFTESSARKTYLKTQRKSIKVMCREIQLGVASAALALENSGLDLESIDHERMGVDFGANLMFSPPDVLKDACWKCLKNGNDEVTFNYDQWGTIGLANMEPLWLLRYLPNMPACHIGISADARGPSNSITLDEASGNLALAEARHVILRDAADVMIAGTTGTRLHPVKSIHGRLWDELAESDSEPATWSRPFDLNRTGQVLGEGACSFILEKQSHAEKRGANILANLMGTGSCCIADQQGKPQIRRALASAMRLALADAGLNPDDIGHLNAHGLGDKQTDVDEAQAIHDVFGSYAEKLPVTALKSFLGNSGSGCGTLELAGSIVSLCKGVVPPTLNYDAPDPDCPLNVVHSEPRSVSNKRMMNINVTRMGQASALIARVA